MRVLWLIWLIMLPVAAAAQQSDKDFLTSYLEQSLSGAGRVVTITGFAGSLSTRATMAAITIADDQGIWLTVKDVVLDWSQSSLLSGQIVITEFSAGEIDLARMPATQGGGLTPEAHGFALPNLPVSIAINSIAARHIVLGRAVLGQPVEGQITAKAQLAGGDGSAELDLLRTDAGPQGHFQVSVAYQSGNLDLKLSAREGAGGVAVGLLGVPGAPSAEFTVQGAGPLDAFAADISLKTDAVTRLAGKVVLSGANGQRGFTADLAGDPTPVFLPAYAAFFGPDVALHAKGQSYADGRMELSEFQVTARALSLDGTVSLDATGAPEAFALTGKLGLPEGSVLLPLPGPTRLDSATLSLNYDRKLGDDWTMSALLSGLSQPAFAAMRLVLAGRGLIHSTADGSSFTGSLTFGAGGLKMTNPGLAAALGETVDGKATLDWQSDAGLKVDDLTLRGGGFDLTGAATMDVTSTGLAVTGHVDGHAADLSRYAVLTGLALRGNADLGVVFDSNLITGSLAASGTLDGRSLGLGVVALDSLLHGDTRLDFDGARDATGITVKSATLATTGLQAQMKGKITSAGLNLTGDGTLSDLAAVGSRFGGAVSGKAALTGPLDKGVLSITASGSDLTLGQTEMDRLLQGNSQLTAAFDLTTQGLALKQLALSNPQMTAQVKAAGGAWQVEQRLSDLAVLYPQFPGALTAKGTVQPGANGYGVDLAVKGPGQIDARVKGQIAGDFSRADLGIAGTAQASVANALAAPRSLSGPVKFDLRMLGPIGLTALSGPVSLSGGRLADPSQNFGIRDMTGTAQLAAGQARISGKAAVTTGGHIGVEGSLAITAPYLANLAVKVQGVVLRDPRLYKTSVTGALTVTGPASGGAVVAGAVALGRTEVLIPASTFAPAADVPGLSHIHEPEDSRSTRGRTGPSGVAGSAGVAAAGYGLNLKISAPNQVFIRGRGLDAELGGSLTLLGSTQRIVPSGSFALIRGRLDILGHRLDLSEATLQLQGALIPFVRIVAAVTSGGITAQVLIAGVASDPQVTFSSTPQLPQEEVLARLLFDRGLDSLTALQAISLAGAIASLAGKGGAGAIDSLRRKTGLDNLDVTSTGMGDTSLTVGKYLTDKAYTEATVTQGGQSSISLNLDVAPNVTLKGHVDSDGQTGIGVFLQRDY